MEYKYPVVDDHYHIYNWKDGQNRPFWETTDNYWAGRNFRAVNINALPAFDVSCNIITALYKLYKPKTYIHGGITYDEIPLPAVMTEGMDPLTQYRELMEIGFDGIKMIETKPDRVKAMQRPVCDPLYHAFFDAVEADGTHMVWHVADPAEFWDKDLAPAFSFENGWFYGDGTFPSYEEIYAQVFAVLDRNPNLKVTFAHFFFLSGDPVRLEALFAKYPNMNVDLTPGGEMYASFHKDPAYYRDFFTRHAARIQFGTDASDDASVVDDNLNIADCVYRFLTTDDEYHLWENPVHGIRLDDEAVEKILSENFLRRVSETPKAINKAALKRYIAKYRHLIRDPQVLADIDAAAERL